MTENHFQSLSLTVEDRGMEVVLKRLRGGVLRIEILKDQQVIDVQRVGVDGDLQRAAGSIFRRLRKDRMI